MEKSKPIRKKMEQGGQIRAGRNTNLRLHHVRIERRETLETEMDPRETKGIEKMEMRGIALRLPSEMKMMTMMEKEIAEPSSLARTI